MKGESPDGPKRPDEKLIRQKELWPDNRAWRESLSCGISDEEKKTKEN